MPEITAPWYLEGDFMAFTTNDEICNVENNHVYRCSNVEWEETYETCGTPGPLTTTTITETTSTTAEGTTTTTTIDDDTTTTIAECEEGQMQVGESCLDTWFVMVLGMVFLILVTIGLVYMAKGRKKR